MQFKVLIADDEIVFRDILVSVVAMIFSKYYPSLELHISVASNGKEELAIAQAESQNIIITDINMPIMDGREAVKKIRLFDKSVPILALTALTDSKDVEEILHSGVSNYTAKPLNQKLFVAQIKSFVNLFLKSGFLYNRKAINLVSKQIFKRKVIFDIDKVEDVEEFWEYFLELDAMLRNSYIQAILQNVYNFELLMLKKRVANEIILEENEKNYYITVSQIEGLSDDAWLKYLSVNDVTRDLVSKDENFITFILSKYEHIEQEEKIEIEKKENPIEQLKEELAEAREVDLRYTTYEKVTALELAEELDHSIEDKMEEFEDNLESLFYHLSDFEDAENERVKEILVLMVELFDNFNKVVENIGLFNVIFRAFNSFTLFLRELDDAILYDKEKRILLATFIRGLIDDLEQWIVNVFIEHATDDIHYLDASFAENCLEIEKIFLENDEEELSDEDEEDDDSLEFF